MTTDKQHGEVLRCVSGALLVHYPSRAVANRVRRVVRLWTERGGWTGPMTLRAVADHAAQSQGKSALCIVEECEAYQREQDRRRFEGED